MIDGCRRGIWGFAERHRFILSFVALSCCSGLGVGVARVATSLYALDLRASELQLGVIAGAQSIGLLLTSLPVGVLVDRWGPLRMFSVGSAVAGALYVAMPLVRVAEYLAVCSALVSCFMPCRFIALNAVFMQQIERIGVARAGWFRGTHMMGFFLAGPVVAAALVGALGYLRTFWLIGASFFLTVLLAPAVMRFYAEGPGPARRLTFMELRDQLALLGRDQDLRHTAAIEFFTQAAAQFFAFFMVVIAIESYRFDAAQAATLLTLHGTAFVAVLFGAGVGLRHLGYARFLVCSFALVVTGLLMLGLSAQAWQLWVGSPLLGVGLGMLQTVSLSRFARISLREGGGRVAGINAFVGPAGGLIGSVAGGALGHVVGLQMIFVLLVPVFVWMGHRLTLRPVSNELQWAVPVPAKETENES